MLDKQPHLRPCRSFRVYCHPLILIFPSKYRWANQICADDAQERGIVLASMKCAINLLPQDNMVPLTNLQVCGTTSSMLGGLSCSIQLQTLPDSTRG